VFCNVMLVVRGLELLFAVSKGLAVVLDKSTRKMPKHDFVIPRLAPPQPCQDPEINQSLSSIQLHFGLLI
jgi:hypothetical protein